MYRWTTFMLTSNHNRMRKSRQSINVLDRHDVNLVIDVETLDVFPVVFHDNVDEVIYSHILVSD